MRHIKIADGYVTYSEHGGAAKCGQCPVRDGNGVCPIRAEVVAAMRPCCRYGHQKILSQHAKNYNQRKERKTNHEMASQTDMPIG